MSGIIDLSGYVLVPRERLRQLEEIEAKSKASIIQPTVEWPRRPPLDAPEPDETAKYTVHFFDDMGHLGYHFTPEYTGKTDLLLAVLPYSGQDTQSVYKNIDDENSYIFIELKPDRPMKRNVSVKLDGVWVTVCLDYTSI